MNNHQFKNKIFKSFTLYVIPRRYNHKKKIIEDQIQQRLNSTGTVRSFMEQHDMRIPTRVQADDIRAFDALEAHLNSTMTYGDFLVGLRNEDIHAAVELAEIGLLTTNSRHNTTLRGL